MSERKIETTDGRYRKIDDDAWWDTTGINIVPEAVVDRYMGEHRVGIVVTQRQRQPSP